MVAHFRAFGHVIDCHVVRDKESGISRGFAFLTFLEESEAESAIECSNQMLDGKPIRVSKAQKMPNLPASHSKNERWSMDSLVLPRFQTRVYIGPLDDDVTNGDITEQLSQYGVIKGIAKLKTTSKKNFAFVEFKDAISVRRTFTNKNFIKGKYVKVTLSKLAMELVLSPSVIFFYEAHHYCHKPKLELHFKQYGQIFRCFQFLQEDMLHPKSYGFIDFVGPDSVPRSVIQKQQLVNEQFVRVSKFLPMGSLQDLMATSDKHGNAMLRKMDVKTPDQGTWGAALEKNEQVLSEKVRIPSKCVARLIGERGKNISEICRDSNTKIMIPKVEGEETSVVVTVTGTKLNIKTAQYLMQKLLKSAT